MNISSEGLDTFKRSTLAVDFLNFCSMLGKLSEHKSCTFRDVWLENGRVRFLSLARILVQEFFGTKATVDVESGKSYQVLRHR